MTINDNEVWVLSVLDRRVRAYEPVEASNDQSHLIKLGRLKGRPFKMRKIKLTLIDNLISHD